MTPVHSSGDDITVAAVLGVVLAFFIASKALWLLFQKGGTMNEKTNLPALQKTNAKTCGSQTANSKKGGSKTRQISDAPHLSAVILCTARTKARCIRYGKCNTSLCTGGAGEYDRLPEETWLEYRRKGIGGSDAAAILGVSPFATARDLYYDKLKIVSYEDPESNWVQKKMGHLLEEFGS